MAKGEVRYRLVLDSKDFVNGIKAAKAEASAMAQDMSGKLGKAGSVLSSMGPAGIAAAAGIGALVTAAAAATKAVIDATAQAMKYGDTMAALQDKTGLSTKALQDLEVAAKLGNSSLDAIASAVNKMQKGIVDGSDAFRKLGISLTDLKRMSPEGQFREVAKAIDAINDPAQKAAARIAVFGKSGNDLAGTLKAAAAGATELGGAISEDALSAAAELQDQADLLDSAWDRVVLQFGAAVAQSPELRRGMDDITNALVKMAEAIGRLTPQIVAMFDKIVVGARIALEAIKSIAVAQMHGPLAGAAAFKAGFDQVQMDSMFTDVSGGSSSSGVKGRRPTTFAGGGSKAPKKPKQNFLPQLNLSNSAISALLNATPGSFKQDPVDILPRGNFGMAGFDLLNGKPATEMAAAAKATIDWRSALMDVSNIFSSMGGRAGSALASIAGGIAGIGSQFKALKTPVAGGGLAGAGGLGGLLGKVGAGLGIAGSAISIGATLFSGIKSLFGGKSKEEKAAEEAAKQQKIKDTIGQLEGLMQKAKAMKMEQLTAGVGGLAAMFGHLATKTDESGERFRRLEFFGAALFKKLKEEGLSSAEAFEKMGPALDQAIEAARSNGQELGGVLGQLAAFRELVKSNEGLVGAVSGFNDLVTAVGVTRESIVHIQPEMQAFFDEMISKGFTADQAVGELAPTLFAIREAARAGRIEVDAGTQALINQAEAGGHFDNLKDPMAEMVEIQKMMLELWASIAQMQGVTLPASLREYINTLNQAQAAQSGMGGGADFGLPGGGGQPKYFPDAGGGDITPGQMSAGFKGMGGNLQVPIVLDGRELGKGIVKLTRNNTGEMRSQGQRYIR